MTASEHQVLQALKEGRITKREADAYLQHAHETTTDDISQKRHVRAYLVLGFMVLSVVLGLVFIPGGPSGHVVFDTETNLTNVTNTSVPVPNVITSLQLSGTMYGDGSASAVFVTDTGTYTVALLTSDPSVIRTSKPSYTPGEDVLLDHVTGNATYYLDDGVTNILVDVPFVAPPVGTYSILVIQNDSRNLSTTTVALLVSDTPLERVTTFGNVCVETCQLNGTNGTLVVSTTDTTLDITVSVEYPVEKNLEPMFTVIPDMIVTQETTFDLEEYFTDPEGSPLFFSTSNSAIVDPVVSGSLLTLMPLTPGTETFFVYASDLVHLVQTEFVLRVEAVNVTPPVTNQSNVTVPLPILNQTNGTPPVTNVTVPDACSNPNPNLRPLECLQRNASEYFPHEYIFWENNARTRVGQFNQIGNLLIKGDIFENSNAIPVRGEFQLGNVGRDGQLATTIWVDTAGNLHLRGRLHEEQTMMQPPPGSYSVLSRRSIYLAYADLSTGSLYIRGNIIPYRRSLG